MHNATWTMLHYRHHFTLLFSNSEIVDIYGKYISQYKANKINFCKLLLHKFPNDCAHGNQLLGFFKKDAPQNSLALLSLIPYSPVTPVSLFCSHCTNVCARGCVCVCVCLRLKHVSQCPSLHGSIPVKLSQWGVSVSHPSSIKHKHTRPASLAHAIFPCLPVPDAHTLCSPSSFSSACFSSFSSPPVQHPCASHCLPTLHLSPLPVSCSLCPLHPLLLTTPLLSLSSRRDFLHRQWGRCQ